MVRLRSRVVQAFLRLVRKATAGSAGGQTPTCQQEDAPMLQRSSTWSFTPSRTGQSPPSRRPLTAIAVLAVLAILHCPRPAQADVIAPGDSIAGQSQLGHAHQWWNTISNIPAATNPLLDSTGANAPLAQVGSVLYLGGSFFSGPVNRTITVQPGTTLFFPVVNGFADNTPLILK